MCAAALERWPQTIGLFSPRSKGRKKNEGFVGRENLEFFYGARRVGKCRSRWQQIPLHETTVSHEPSCPVQPGRLEDERIVRIRFLFHLSGCGLGICGILCYLLILPSTHLNAHRCFLIFSPYYKSTSNSRIHSHPQSHFEMDKALLSALDQLPPITTTVASLHTAASTALLSTRSATAFLHTPLLASRRIQRAESLLCHMRELLLELRALYSRLVSALRSTLAMKQAGKPRWDRLSHEWWRERAEGVLDLVMEVGRSVEGVELELVEGGNYVSRVEGISERVELVVRGWEKVASFVRGWEPIARAVCEGLGEEGSLLPE